MAHSLLDDFKVGRLVAATDIVGLTRAAVLQHQPDRFAVVVHVQPVPHLLPVPVDRQRFAAQGIQDHQRDQFFRELVWTIII